jgi:hypothetical protein
MSEKQIVDEGDHDGGLAETIRFTIVLLNDFAAQ